MNFDAITRLVATLAMDDLTRLNNIVVGQINHLNRQKRSAAAGAFALGDTVRFPDRRGLPGTFVTILVNKINPTTLGGNETTTSGRPGARWRVSPSFCTKVPPKKTSPLFGDSRSPAGVGSCTPDAPGAAIW